MLEIIIIITAIALLLYTVLGGADFGAGVIEIFTGKKGKKVIARAIAPVWEANHVWLILIIVILFNGFPAVYSLISTALHIPIMLFLLGIIFRGSAFTFRHYDTKVDASHGMYTFLFRISSVFTPFFLGITLGALISGRIYLQPADFYGAYIAPWFNWFCITMGLFTTALFTYLAGAFLTGETEEQEEKGRYIKLARVALGTTIISGALVFLTSFVSEVPLANNFFNSPVSISFLSIATLLVPVVWYGLTHFSKLTIRVLMGIHTACIILGWFAIQYPVLVKVREGAHLTFYNTQAPEATLFYLFIALVVGVIIIIPAMVYLFKVFKS